jgi:hypothetical protein
MKINIENSFNALGRRNSSVHTRISVNILADKTEASLNNTLERLTRVILTVMKDGYTVWSTTINEMVVNTNDGNGRTVKGAQVHLLKYRSRRLPPSW